MSSYTVFIEQPAAGESWSAWSSDLHVYATAETREQVVAGITDAIAFHLEGLRADGDTVPEPAASAVEVIVAA